MKIHYMVDTQNIGNTIETIESIFRTHGILPCLLSEYTSEELLMFHECVCQHEESTRTLHNHLKIIRKVV